MHIFDGNIVFLTILPVHFCNQRKIFQCFYDRCALCTTSLCLITCSCERPLSGSAYSRTGNVYCGRKKKKKNILRIIFYRIIFSIFPKNICKYANDALCSRGGYYFLLKCLGLHYALSAKYAYSHNFEAFKWFSGKKVKIFVATSVHIYLFLWAWVRCLFAFFGISRNYLLGVLN